MRVILALLISCSTLLGQQFFYGSQVNFSAPAGGGALFNPTNTAIGANFWWEPSWNGGSTQDYTTNSAVATLHNLSTNGSSFDLTNKVTSHFPFGNLTTLNGFSTVSFVSSHNTYLQSLNWTSPTPFEICWLVSVTNNGGAFQLMQDDSSQSIWFGGTTSPFNFVVSGLGTAALGVTNKFIIINLRKVPGAANAIHVYTNGVAGTSFTDNIALQNGMVLGERTTDAFQSSYTLVSMCAWTNVDFGQASYFGNASRSNEFYYLTNKFALSLP